MTTVVTSPNTSVSNAPIQNPLFRFEQIVNVRDVSDIAPDHIRSGVVIRSALPAFATPCDQEALLALGVRQIVDLRSDNECSVIPTLSTIPNSVVEHVPMVVTPWNFEDLDSGQSAEEFLAVEYLRMMNDSGERICKALNLITEFDGTTLVHCTAGKDRTGIIIALLGVIAAAPIGNIIADYERSAADMPTLAMLLHSKVESLADLSPAGNPVAFESDKRRQLFLNAPRIAVEQVLSRVFPTPHKFFDEIGYSRAARRHLQSKLLLRS